MCPLEDISCHPTAMTLGIKCRFPCILQRKRAIILVQESPREIEITQVEIFKKPCCVYYVIHVFMILFFLSLPLFLD